MVEDSLRVSVEVKIEMDQPLFKGNIQEVTIQETNFSHTNEELFIFECMKRIPTT